MPFISYRTINQGLLLTGIYRTAALAQTAATDRGESTLATEILDANIPAYAEINGGYFVYRTPSTPATNASVDIQLGTSGKGFRLTWRLGELGADGNSWTIATSADNTVLEISFSTLTDSVTLPQPNNTDTENPLQTGAHFLALLNGLDGARQFDASYLAGTDDTTDFLALTGTWSRIPTAAGSPTFSGGVDAGALIWGVHLGYEQNASNKFRAWMNRAHAAYLRHVELVKIFWARDDIGLASVQATYNWLGAVPAVVNNYLKTDTFGNGVTVNSDAKREALVQRIENLPVKVWYGVMRDQVLVNEDEDEYYRDTWKGYSLTSGTAYQDYLDPLTGNLITIDGDPTGSLGVIPLNYDPETLDWVVYI